MSKTDYDLQKVITTIKRVNRAFKEPTVTTVARGRDPFKVLISCLLSLRTKDNVTSAASERLFRLADTPDAMLKLETLDIQGAIYPVGFYRTKSARIKEICRALIEEYGRNVPNDIDTLLKLPGVGRKTANLVVTLGYGKPGICVDTHVHRITNRWGYVRTETPVETEFALRKILPKKYWLIINDVLVTYGQNTCTPVLPKCSICKVYWYCKREGVKKHR
ncbi:MAG: endonuclease III [Planctomycetota bacterium]|jgi:endonuclease-3